MPMMERITLPREPTTPRRARHYLAPRLYALGMPGEAVDELLIAVGEAVTNAVIHGGRSATPIVSRDGAVSDPHPDGADGVTETDNVMLELIPRGDRVAVAITSASTRWRVPEAELPANPLAETGRGLFVMRHFADSVRIEQSRRGTTVYLIRRLRPDLTASNAMPLGDLTATSHGRRRAG
jgi:anti-sigma regulatory factor (Ser/Thr protein kinase)